MRFNFGLLVIILALPWAVSAQAEWQVLDARWRPDANPWAEKQVWDGWIWSEGWGEDEQFWPKYFEPAGSIHVILRNISDQADTVLLSHIDGAPIEEVVTRPDQAGPVIWYRVDSFQLGPRESRVRRDDERWRRIKPQKVERGKWVDCSVRFRSVPKETVRLRFRFGSAGHMEVPVVVKPQRIRLESISFSSEIDRIYIYIRSLDGTKVKEGSVRLDNRNMRARWTEGPKPGDLILAEVKLDPGWEWGTYHLVEVNLRDRTRLVQSVRAWDCYFVVGLFGTTEPARLKDAIAHGINTYFWAEPKSLDEYELNNIPWHDIGYHRPRTKDQTGALLNYNYDEPDAHDFSLGRKLPVMERLGVYAQQVVLPLIRYQRAGDPFTPNLLLVDNTYKPLNWYVYGQIADLFASDPYATLSADQLDYVRHVLDTARGASTPRPLLAVLWVSGWHSYEDGKAPGTLQAAPQRIPEGHSRAPFPDEERIMAFYALGCGAKGVGYFSDHADGMDASKGGVSRNKPLWEELGRINRDVLALAPYLSIGCPLSTTERNESVWVRSLLCGREHMVIVAVNEGHYIGYNTVSTFAWRTPAREVDIAVALPSYFRRCRIQEVKDGALVPAEGKVKSGRLHLKLDEVDTARAFLISAN